MTENPKTICRVCLRSDSKLEKKCISLFENYNNGLIADNINSITNVGIKEGDGLPSKICPDCLLELDTAVNFKSKCEKSNNLLKTNTINDHFLIEIPGELYLDNIKKEETPEAPLSDYLEADFLTEEHYDDEYETKINPDQDHTPIKEEVTVKKSKAIDLKLECHDCGGFFKSKCKLKVHWKKVHLLEKLICQTCKRTFKTFKAFNKHVKSDNTPCKVATKVNIEGTGRQRVFHCRDCDYQSRRIKDIQSHLYTHSGDRPFECDICHRAFSQQSSLQGHQERAHKMFKVEATCQYCGKFLRGRCQVYRHLKLHSQKSVQCDVCHKMLRSKSSLIIHLARHTGVKMYTCELCASTFYTLSELCNHKRTMHEKRKYIFKCDICSYVTHRNETIKRHKSRHTSTNVCCLVCGYFLPSAEALLQHQKRHIKKFQCPYCDLKYTRRDTLNKHVRNKHKFTFASLPSKPVVKTEAPVVYKVCDEMIEVEVNAIDK